jgi:hypothetical protein
MHQQLSMFGGTVVMMVTFIFAIGAISLARHHLLGA